ncbi:hypothetical protein SNE35_02975 [Paucibacter sp. R3-3]|uniref:DUF4348 domain-containing protein n=1 Tax=Roseateles agri TaxID=3098619 RepID=A0ABU5DCD6_9BURK|nr:hypothetical protein [Paucibacter sp. R3-3]MDY0743446.1 hypothetical protein [Paucibacter sp. R3-3]
MTPISLRARLTFALLGAATFTPAHSATRCAPGFVEFISKFERGVIDQTEHTKFPLRYSLLDSDGPELTRKVLWLDQSRAATFESFPSPEDQARLHVKRAFVRDKTGRCAVKLNVENSDIYAMTFTFARWNKTWRLVEIDDDSL